MPRRNTIEKDTPTPTEGQTTIEDVTETTEEVTEATEQPLFTLTDKVPPTTTRKGSSQYRAVINQFIESGLAHAIVNMRDHTPQQVYNGLRTALRAVPEYAKRAKVVRRQVGDNTEVYLIAKAAA